MDPWRTGLETVVSFYGKSAVFPEGWAPWIRPWRIHVSFVDTKTSSAWWCAVGSSGKAVQSFLTAFRLQTQARSEIYNNVAELSVGSENFLTKEAQLLPFCIPAWIRIWFYYIHGPPNKTHAHKNRIKLFLLLIALELRLRWISCSFFLFPT